MNATKSGATVFGKGALAARGLKAGLDRLVCCGF